MHRRAGGARIGLTGWQLRRPRPIRQVHPLLLTAGVLGASLVFAIAWLIPKAGAGPVMITLLAGQVIGGLVMSHFGWLGSPVQPITITKIARCVGDGRGRRSRDVLQVTFGNIGALPMKNGQTGAIRTSKSVLCAWDRT